MALSQTSSPDILVENALATGFIAAEHGERHEACPFVADSEFYLKSAWLLGWERQNQAAVRPAPNCPS